MRSSLRLPLRWRHAEIAGRPPGICRPACRWVANAPRLAGAPPAMWPAPAPPARARPPGRRCESDGRPPVPHPDAGAAGRRNPRFIAATRPGHI